MNHLIPLSLYIHTPWCERKCPYCDFNSHPLRGALPEEAYLKALCEDLDAQMTWIDRPIHSIFIGGGTPSLLSAEFYRALFIHLKKSLDFNLGLEITLEANPGSVEQQRFLAYREIGINRLSLGVQSFQREKLKKLGRIHSAEEALTAVQTLKNAGFTNFNLDLMFGLEKQTQQEALADLEQAIALSPNHLSWYQLTLEPNTLFYKYPPVIPDEDTLWEIQEAGQALLAKNGYAQYEISAYAKPNQEAMHNMNYWLFGDYLALGAGAHGKITDQTLNITRYFNPKHPTQYLQDSTKRTLENIPIQARLFEFLLNALRLKQAVSLQMITDRTGLTQNEITQKLMPFVQEGWLVLEKGFVQTTQLGWNFLNNLLEALLDANSH